MNSLRSSLAALAAALLAAPGIHAQTTATTDPVGFMTIDLPVGSDTIVAAPLSKAPVFQGAVTSLNGFVVTVTGAAFGDLTTAPHYVQATTGSQAGMIFDVASNTADTITLVNNGVTPTGLSAGTSFKVIPYWTLGTLFPSTDQGVSFTPSASASPAARRTLILFPNNTGSGINRAANNTFFFSTNSWRNVNSASVDVNNTPILPESYIIVRNPTNAASGLKLTVAGSVNTGANVIQLDRLSSGPNDNYVSPSRPTDLTLDQLGLITSGAFTPSAGTGPAQRRDLLLTFNNSAIGFNKAPTATYYYVSNAGTNEWRSTAGTNNAGGTVIPASLGLVIRKATNADTTSQFWTNTISIAP